MTEDRKAELIAIAKGIAEDAIAEGDPHNALNLAIIVGEGFHLPQEEFSFLTANTLAATQIALWKAAE